MAHANGAYFVAGMSDERTAGGSWPTGIGRSAPLDRLVARAQQLSARTAPMTHDDLDETSRVMDLALDAREALGTPSLLPADWAPPEPAPLDVLRTWGPCPLALDRATERLTDTLDGSWFADDELACLLDDLLHAVSRYRLDVLRVLDDSAHANRAVLAWPRRPSPGSATPGRRGRAVPR